MERHGDLPGAPPPLVLFRLQLDTYRVVTKQDRADRNWRARVTAELAADPWVDKAHMREALEASEDGVRAAQERMAVLAPIEALLMELDAPPPSARRPSATSRGTG